MVDATMENAANHRLLTANSALLLATNDNELLSAVELTFTQPIELFLFRLGQSEQRPDVTAMLSAHVLPLGHGPIGEFAQYWSADTLPLVVQLLNSNEQVWTRTNSTFADYGKLLKGPAKALTAIKLYRFAPHQRLAWSGFVLIVWPESFVPGDEELNACAVLSHIASAVLSSHQNVALRLLKVNSALLLAPDLNEMLAALAACVDDCAAIHLFEVEQTAPEASTGAKWLASWPTHPSLLQGSANRRFAAVEMPLLHKVETSEGPIWFAENASDSAETLLPASLGVVQSPVALPLYERSEHSIWHALVVFTWDAPHAVSLDERYLLTAVSQSVSSFVLGWRRHHEALDNLHRLRELDRIKDDFLYGISHELRTPLNGIIGSADFILSDLVGPISVPIASSARVIQESGLYLRTLVEEILDFATLQAGTLRLYPERLSIAEVATEALQKLNPTSLDLRITLPQDLPPILADRLRLQQILINLLSNALKFSESGPIEIGGHREGAVLVVFVRDSGIGIDPRDWQTVFEPFRQLETGLARAHGGAGLGLSICKRLVEMHGGRIWVESVPGQGSTFCFSMPLFVQETVRETPVH